MSIKLTDEEIKRLPPEFQKGLEDGSVLAIEVPKPTMSNRWFTVCAALIVGAMLVPIWVPLTSVAFLGAAFGALGWMFLYWFEGHSHAVTKLKMSIAVGTLDRVFQLLDNKDNLDGTKEGECGLTTCESKNKDVLH